MKNNKNIIPFPQIVRPGSLYTLRRRFRLPDGKEYAGPPAMAACVLEAVPESSGLLCLAAPVQPGVAMAMAQDWTWDSRDPLGFPFRVTLPAVEAIPVTALGEYRGRITLPPASAWQVETDRARRTARRTGAFGLLEPGSDYFEEIEELKMEWNGLRTAARRVRQWVRQGRLLALPALDRRGGHATSLAAAAELPWEENPVLSRLDFADRDGSLAVVIDRSRRQLQVDTKEGLTLQEVRIDGVLAEMRGPDPWEVTLGEGPLSPMWVCLGTNHGDWFFRVEG